MPDIRNRSWFTTCMLAIAGVLLSAAAFAQADKQQQSPPGNLVDTWVMRADAGKIGALADALREHVAWRKQKGDPRRWTVYQPAVGDDLNFFVVRSEPVQWKDFDSYETWSREAGARKQFSDQVGPHLSNLEHYIGRIGREQSYWPQSDTEYRLFRVTHHQLRPGAYATVNQSLRRLRQVATDENWGRPWAIEWSIGGDGGMTVVFPYTSWEGMSEPNPTFMQVLGRSLGSEEAAQQMMTDLSSQFESSMTTIYRVRPDLSTPQ